MIVTWSLCHLGDVHAAALSRPDADGDDDDDDDDDDGSGLAAALNGGMQTAAGEEALNALRKFAAMARFAHSAPAVLVMRKPVHVVEPLQVWRAGIA